MNSRYIAVFLVAMTFLCQPLISVAEETAEVLPNVIQNGIEAYKTDGPEAAIKMWVKNGPLEDNKDVLSSSSLMTRIHAFFGPFVSYELVQVHNITPSSEIVYLILNHKSGAAFMKILLFKPIEKDWIVTQFDYNTKPELIFPQQFLSHCPNNKSAKPE